MAASRIRGRHPFRCRALALREAFRPIPSDTDGPTTKSFWTIWTVLCRMFFVVELSLCERCFEPFRPTRTVLQPTHFGSRIRGRHPSALCSVVEFSLCERCFDPFRPTRTALQQIILDTPSRTASHCFTIYQSPVTSHQSHSVHFGHLTPTL